MPPSPASPNKWAPYSGPKDFNAGMATVLVALVCCTAVGLAIHAVVRLLLRLFRRYHHQPSPPPSPPPTEPGTNGAKQSHDRGHHRADELPSLVFSAGTKLAGAEAECAICLTEFAEGDQVRVLPACNHGFHIKCVEAWLDSRPSCPTCRRSCRPPGELPEEP